MNGTLEHRHGPWSREHHHHGPHRHPWLIFRSTETAEHGHTHGLVDPSIIRSRAGVRAVSISLVVLAVTAGLGLKSLNVAGWSSPSDWILPAVTLGLINAAYLARLARGGMLEVLSQDYIRTARAKGLSVKDIVLKHAFVNALNPVITAITTLAER